MADAARARPRPAATSTTSSACTAVAAGLRGVERRAAAGEDDRAPSGSRGSVGTRAQPLRLRRDRLPRRLAGHERVYTIGRGWRSSSARRSTTACASSPRRCRRRSRSSCFVMLAAGSRYETRRDERHRALRRAHVLQGHRAPPDRARHRRRDRRDRRRVQRLHRQGVHGLLRPLRRRRPRHRARRARRHAPPLEVRPRGDRAREGRDPRGDEHVLRHAARLHRRASTRRSSSATTARLGHPRHEGDDPRPRRARRSSTTSTSWYTPDRMVVGVGGIVGDGLDRAARGAARRPARRRRPARPRRSQLDRRTGRASRVHTKDVRPGAPLPRRAELPARRIPTATRSQLLATVLGGGMSSRLFTEVRERRGLAYYVFGVEPLATPTPARSTRRRASTSSASTRRSTTIVERVPQIAAEPVPADELEKARVVRQGPLRAPAREPAGPDHVRPPPRGARGPGARARRRCSPSSTRSRPRTSSASRRT